MKKSLLLLFVIGLAMMLSFCEKEAEVSPERFKVLVDTVGQELEYDIWMDLTYELSKNYPQEYAAGMAMVRSAERAIMESDEKRFRKVFDLLKNYPENGALEVTDQIAFGNRLAWVMSQQMLLFNEAPAVMDFTIAKFKVEEEGLKWRDELGAMIFDTQASIYEKQDEMEKALEAYGVALDYLEQPETLLRRGLIFENQENFAGALEDYIAALQMSPGKALINQKVIAMYAKLNPGKDSKAFMSDLHTSLDERRKEEVLSEVFYLDAPEFQITDFNGRSINNANMLGRVLFVDFWATWCNPCRRELPEFQAFYEIYKNDPRVVFVAASTDQEKQKVQPYIDEMKFTFPIAYAGDTATKFGVEGIPSLFIIGPQGKIRYKIVGFDPDKDFVREMTWRLESLLDS
ncbi:MAG: redoxin domain-containing protein [Candidatus Marinimicrobia bacterium]|jgi:thiol-disulfide isomerase/thioredoxin|nr:redoxin domain-containing protein [Candidatus Neomarinimicrobiota bacterium]MBT4360881.1 redoxin domain-containing protein [Candidatus Neomarinimicrobiota bacterium]MBT4715343.1 redoxin domain-containing protein [Candidatus Neomarinimicrobiota bacterium]MBT4947005.1 redoxin domain-containing protein [Candidatus Neomarinimicrobiota bacterium]MBT5268366.1 redoxin domain-containing protein [Candidatus Neomarinimicrobiota bacterium]